MCPVAKRMLICMAQKRKEDAVINKIPFLLLERFLSPSTILKFCYVTTAATVIHRMFYTVFFLHPGGAPGHGHEVLPVDPRPGLHGGDLGVADRGVPLRHRGGAHALGGVDDGAPEVVALEQDGDAARGELV